ncbi:MAG: cadherin repeat domain-containing protein, partial [Planctomycetaceae bacterium]|nr:cadherin repeat domain-containing protein [Planctomycetaceae bacterium]
MLEPRALLSATLSPVAIGGIIDSPRDGIADSLSATPFALRSSSLEYRANAEFDLANLPEPTTLAVLDFTASINNAAGNQLRQFDILVYAADGQITLSDFNVTGATVATINLTVDAGYDTYRYDVTSEVQQLRDAGATKIGVQMRAFADTFPGQLVAPLLGINEMPVPRGFRGWQMTPNVIRADGVESSRLEVDAGGEVNGVFLNTATTSFLLTKPGTGIIELRDDGLDGDRVAGDFIYTSGEFRYDTSRSFPEFYKNDPDSPRGLDFASLGAVIIEEVDGTQAEQFLIRPELGIMSTDIPEVSRTQLSADIAVTPHLININSSLQATQQTAREARSRINLLTQAVYSVMPDEFDFINLISTYHVEDVQRLNSKNFVDGFHNSVQVTWNGSRQTLDDRTASFGSDGRLLGVTFLDTASRGLYGGNATHELVHQWSAFYDTALGIADNTGHFLYNSSAASLVGGFEWVSNGDGSYTINYDEGRNGATHASPLDLYMMGLIDASEVPDILVFNPSSTPTINSGNPSVPASAISRTTTVEDIIAAHGERVDTTGTVQTDFRIGFVAESIDRFLTPTELTFYEILAGHYTRDTPTDEADPYVGFGWASIDRFFGHGSTWGSLLPGQTDYTNTAPVAADANFNVRADAPIGTIVGTVSAADADAGQNLQYSIISTSQRNTFRIDPSTGQIAVSSTTLLGSTSQFVLEVRVVDNAVIQSYDTVTVTINVDPGNQTPTIADQSLSVAENSANGTVVGMVVASDPDAGQVLSWAITSGNNGAFAIDATTGEITVNNGGLLNCESNSQYVLQVTVTDNGSPQRSATAAVTIQLQDVNENPLISPVTVSLNENSSVGTSVTTMSATDPDIGQTLTYSIASGNSLGAFAINSLTGEVTVADSSQLDFETVPSFFLSIGVTDNGTPAKTAFGRLVINLLDVNEVAQVDDLAADLPENSANGTFVVRVQATDPDSGQLLTYSITDGNQSGAFNINSFSGNITIADSTALDFETTSSFALTVTVTDSGTPALSNSAVVTVRVIDQNDAPHIPDDTLAVVENSSNGFLIGRLLATDADVGQSLTFAITDGNTGGAFAIDGNTGEVTVANAAMLDYETTSQFFLTVTVTDNGSPALSDSAAISVLVINRNEAPALADATFEIPEGSANDSVVGTV